MTKKGAVAARTAAVKRRTFTREFKLKVIREVEPARARRKSLANIKSPKTRSPSGGASIGSIRIALLLVVVTPTLTKHACTNSSAWWADSPWRMTF